MMKPEIYGFFRALDNTQKNILDINLNKLHEFRLFH